MKPRNKVKERNGRKQERNELRKDRRKEKGEITVHRDGRAEREKFC